MFKSRAAFPALAAALTAVVISACGSSAPPTTASLSSSGPTQTQLQRLQNDAVKFSDCMRNHGIANFPDAPGPNGAGGRTWKNAFQNSSPAFVSADTACQHLMPTSGQSQNSAPGHRQIEAMLAFARCIRSHGFARFPDPNSSGITHAMIASAGINLHQPALVRAADACVAVTHGALTRAIVTRFIAGQ
jgi:hypothetical protein